ncbi:MAG: ABC transporter permease [Galactobacter sp.]
MQDPTSWLLLGATLASMVLLATVLLRAQHVHLDLRVWTAVGRAILQLCAVALLLRAVLTHWWALVLFVVLMLTTASFTGAGRAKRLPRGRVAAAMGILVGPAVSVTIILTTGVVDRTSEQVIAICGILIGSAMTASTLSLRQLGSQLDARRPEVEAWLALGATPSQSVAELRIKAVHEALLPNVDQTRSTGLVTLPGAFVGALFGGASPVDAAVFQIIVLVGILLTQVVTSSVATWWAARSPLLPVPEAMARG